MNNLSIHSIGFDLDGTIVDSVPWFLELYQNTFASVAGIAITKEDLLSRLGPPEEEVFKNLAPNLYEECLYKFRKESYSTISKLKLFPGIVDSLELCRYYDFNIGLVTGRSKYLAEVIVEQFNLQSYFDYFSYGEEGKGTKVHALNEFSNFFQTNAENCAYLGDFETDYEAARQVGMKPLTAGWGVLDKSHYKYLKEPFYFSKVENFIGWIKESANDSRI